MSTATTKGQKPVIPEIKVPTAPVPEPKAPKEKRPKAVYQTLFPTSDAAVAEANGREKGPRRAFTVCITTAALESALKQAKDGKVTFNVVAPSERRACGEGFLGLGGTVDEIGKIKRSKVVGLEGILAAVNSLPEAEKAKVLEQLKMLNGQK